MEKGRKEGPAPLRRVGEAALAIYLAGLCDYQDKLSPGERSVVLLLAPDRKQAKVLLDYAEGTLKSTPIMRATHHVAHSRDVTLKTGITLEVRNAGFRRIVALFALRCWLMNVPSGYRTRASFFDETQGGVDSA